MRGGSKDPHRKLRTPTGCARAAQGARSTHKSVSGGPMMVTCHSKMLASSTNPAENPSTGFLLKSGRMSARRAVSAAGWRGFTSRASLQGQRTRRAHSGDPGPRVGYRRSGSMCGGAGGIGIGVTERARRWRPTPTASGPNTTCQKKRRLRRRRRICRRCHRFAPSSGRRHRTRAARSPCAPRTLELLGEQQPRLVRHY